MVKPGSCGLIITSPTKIKTIIRRKNIVIEDCFKSLLTHDFKSSLLSCRNPFKQDERIVNYDLDTEDEMAEEQGEDLDEENQNSEDDDSDLEE